MRFAEIFTKALFLAAAVAVASLAEAVREEKVRKDEVIMLNITGGGEALAKSEQKVVYAKPHLVLDPDLPAEEVVSAVMGLY